MAVEHIAIHWSSGPSRGRVAIGLVVEQLFPNDVFPHFAHRCSRQHLAKLNAFRNFVCGQVGGAMGTDFIPRELGLRLSDDDCRHNFVAG
jgi:hypothetical protein